MSRSLLSILFLLSSMVILMSNRVTMAGAPDGKAVAFSPTDPLPWDSRVIRGELSNGQHYMVMKHATPPGRVALYMLIASGSMNETEQQRGLAHYLEHLAFNGSENFPPGTVIKLFENLGMTFGRHQNASTGFDQTIYILELPDNSIDKLETGLKFFADVNSRLLLNPEEIDKERQIIMEEKNARQSAGLRVQEQLLKRIAPGTILGERLPIGTEERIKGVQRPDFVDYYSKWYGPSNSTVMLVGDLDEATMVDLVKKHFSTPGERKPKPTRVDVGIKPFTAQQAIVITDAELPRSTVALTKIGPARKVPATYGEAREDLVRDMASAAFTNRARKKSQRGELKSLVVFANAGNASMSHSQTSVTAGGDPTNWKTMLEEICVETQRAVKFGFNQQELDDVRKELISRAEQSTKSEPTMQARAMLGRMTQAALNERSVMSASQRLEMLNTYAPTITLAEVNAAFAKEFDPSTAAAIVTTNTAGDVPSEAMVLEIVKAALAKDVKAEAEEARADKLMDKLPEPGTVAEQSVHEASGVWSGWLANGARVHHRFMDYRKDSVGITITVYGGEILETAENRGISRAAAVAWGQAATSKLRSSDIDAIMTDKKVSVGGGASQYAMELSINGSPVDVETGFQLAHLLLTDPKLEQAAFDKWKESTLQSIDAIDKNPQQKFGTLVAAAIYPENEVRTRELTKDQVNKLTRDAAEAWLKKIIANGSIEVSIVGEIPREKAIELASRYVGSLSTRDRISTKLFAEQRVMKKRDLPVQVKQTMVTNTDQANVFVGFYGPDETNLADLRPLNLATRIMSSRMIQNIREEKQLVYSIGTRLSPGSTYPGMGMIQSSSATQPPKTEALAAEITAMFDAFAASGPTEDEMSVVRKQVANTLDESLKEPGTWRGALENMTFDGRSLDELLTDPAKYQAITAEQVLAAWKKYYTPGKVVVVELKPVKKEG
jgi:zinc protease